MFRIPDAAFFAVLSLALTPLTTVVAAEEDLTPQILFTNVNVFDGKSDTLADGMDGAGRRQSHQEGRQGRY